MSRLLYDELRGAIALYNTQCSLAETTERKEELPDLEAPVSSAEQEEFRVPIAAVCVAESAPLSSFSPPEGITCASYMFVSLGETGDDLKLLASGSAEEERQCASLTKMCTFLLCAQHPHLLHSPVTVSSRAAGVHGTTAGIQEGEVYSLSDLLYAMMLPSGNDAATALAEFVGRQLPPLTRAEQQAHEKWGNGPHYDGDWSIDDPLTRFVTRMNSTALRIGMPGTHFSNSHGLMHHMHHSTASDMIKLTALCLRSPLFRRVVSCASFQTSTLRPGPVRKRTWKNTNRLLSMRLRGFSCNGVKTGITPAAGGCLSSVFSVDNYDEEVVGVVLGSRNKTLRFVDTQRLVEAVAAALPVTP